MSFSEANFRDPLVVSLPINHVLVKRTLIDMGSHVDLITLDALKKIGVDLSHPNHWIFPNGEVRNIVLNVSFGT